MGVAWLNSNKAQLKWVWLGLIATKPQLKWVWLGLIATAPAKMGVAWLNSNKAQLKWVWLGFKMGVAWLYSNNAPAEMGGNLCMSYFLPLVSVLIMIQAHFLLMHCSMESDGSLGVLSVVHLDHSRDNGWKSLASDALRPYEVPSAPLETVEVSKEETEEDKGEGGKEGGSKGGQ
jgi:hypothetical protein